jgi:hypothetical protein
MAWALGTKKWRKRLSSLVFFFSIGTLPSPGTDATVIPSMHSIAPLGVAVVYHSFMLSKVIIQRNDICKWERTRLLRACEDT